jgi:tryptophan halogenase
MTTQPVRKVVIIGGGTAGWMAALPLARLRTVAGSGLHITLVESPEIGTIGVGEATLPPIRAYNATLGLDAVEFLRKTHATFKLGIEFCDWRRPGHRFFHGFGGFGPPLGQIDAFSCWLRHRARDDTSSYEDWSMATEIARRNRFAPPDSDPRAPLGAYSYAFHFDAGLYAAFLREQAEEAGVTRVEGTVTEVSLRPVNGFVSAVTLSDGRRIEGDLFIDCSGQRALLIGQTLQVGYEDWSTQLPCNRAWAVPSESAAQLVPFTRSTARSAGWQWRIPLQHRIGNGMVFASDFISDEAARAELLQGLDTPALAEPRLISFTTGRRRRIWDRNVVAIGLSSGFVEPLESTAIQLIIDGVGRLIELFPDASFAPALAAEYNSRMHRQYESIRDFIVLHYKLTQRDDTPFWRHCAAMPIPDTLAHQIELFRSSGRVAIHDPDSFREPSWISLFMGLGAVPARHDPQADAVPENMLAEYARRVRATVVASADSLPEHAAYIQRQLGVSAT